MLFDAARIEQRSSNRCGMSAAGSTISTRAMAIACRGIRMLGVVRCLRERDVRQHPKEVIDRERSIADWSRLWQRRQPSDISSCMPGAIT
ncbi:hypothetical protein ACMAVI_006535 [Burkholderia cenocepacia]|uniref:hypothetical protein n=1 Tax=Burkholderia cenocepacia TaxID=95486 RepID=UPI0028764771|nr:hypothetical protein [Burkholderia cenocepacia]MDS0849626.1 hypothetical protein [Burkholderia cenocepacia]